jgi:hypothetical protein
VWLVLGTDVVKAFCLAGRLVVLLSVLTHPTFWFGLSGCFLSKFCTIFAHRMWFCSEYVT